ncbi:hypothetical protein [Nesterenkonia jeotgali]|uniref:Uncharacterized protein n=1 Tax=Nesterenkonia jeotgali TaxID=317018 RepID=A0A0W8ICW9_9MICC|nr:hypothetical protein [Nesterenkonia jeotgali]KUG57789.1 hypothetical protein AVL63_04500 [Nesterenkonia jeotgali]
MSPEPLNPRALADTAAYAEELKQANVDGDIGLAAGCGFARGRMVHSWQLEITARGLYARIVSSGEESDWDRGLVSEDSKKYWRRTAARVFDAAGFTVLTPPP